MAIEIVDFPINNGDFPVSYVKLPEGIQNVFPLNWFKGSFTENHCFFMRMFGNFIMFTTDVRLLPCWLNYMILDVVLVISMIDQQN